MKKIRVFSSFIVLILVYSLIFSTTAIAAVAPYSSPTLLSYGAWLKKGNSSGVLRVSCDITANTIADSIGVSSIQLCNANGLPIKLVSGSVENGLIAEDTVDHRPAYLFSADSGSTYYAVVTVFATIGDKSDSRTITTSKTTAP